MCIACGQEIDDSHAHYKIVKVAARRAFAPQTDPIVARYCVRCFDGVDLLVRQVD